MGGPRYQPGYYRNIKPTGQVFVMRTPGGKGATETKYYDTTKALTAIPESTDWTGTEFDPATQSTLFCPVQGAQINNRIGRKVLLKKIRIRGVIRPNVFQDANDVVAPCAVRIIVYQDKQTNGAQAQGEDVMAAPATAAAENAFCAFQSLGNLGRFRVWKDKTYVPRDGQTTTDGANTSSITAGAAIPFKYNLKLGKGIPVHFNSSNGGAGDGDVGDIVDNSFHILIQASSTAWAYQCAYQARCVYTDQ
uniref:hypothetical protein n=1 Tax=Shewanella sp. TaxID=50422 RepID=UPI004047F323